MTASAVIKEGEQPLIYPILPKFYTPYSIKFTHQGGVQLTVHAPPTTGENNENSPPADAPVRLSAGDLQRVIAGLAALERQLRGAV